MAATPALPLQQSKWLPAGSILGKPQREPHVIFIPLRKRVGSYMLLLKALLAGNLVLEPGSPRLKTQLPHLPAV